LLPEEGRPVDTCVCAHECNAGRTQLDLSKHVHTHARVLRATAQTCCRERSPPTRLDRR
jgi:hypothetical protein